MFKQHTCGNTTYWYDPLQLEEAVTDAFDLNFWRSQGAILGSAQGRGTTWFVAGKQREYAIRHYYRGGMLGNFVRDHYFYTGINNTRSCAELTILRKLKNSGVNVPAAIAAKVVRYGCFYKAEIITEKISCSTALVDLLVDQTLSTQIYYQVGAEIKKMHNAGVNHTDLNCHNILLQKGQTVWIIDFDKCYTQKGDKWKASNLDRLHRSFSKERVKKKIKFDDKDWESLIEGYEA